MWNGFRLYDCSRLVVVARGRRQIKKRLARIRETQAAYLSGGQRSSGACALHLRDSFNNGQVQVTKRLGFISERTPLATTPARCRRLPFCTAFREPLVAWECMDVQPGLLAFQTGTDTIIFTLQTVVNGLTMESRICKRFIFFQLRSRLPAWENAQDRVRSITEFPERH